MKIVYNLKSFEPVPEGRRVLEITESKCSPSGKPQQLDVTFKDIETGRTLKSTYKFNIQGAVMAMGFLCKTALHMEDAGEFDTTTDTPKLIGKRLLAEVVHTQGSTPKEDGSFPIFANISKILGEASDVNALEDTPSVVSPRNAISNNTDDLD